MNKKKSENVTDAVGKTTKPTNVDLRRINVMCAGKSDISPKPVETKANRVDTQQLEKVEKECIRIEHSM